MAAKHDAKKARANMWVTHQNLARSKGGRPGFFFQEKAPRKVAPAAPAPAPAVKDAEAPAADAPADETRAR